MEGDFHPSPPQLLLVRRGLKGTGNMSQPRKAIIKRSRPANQSAEIALKGVTEAA